MPFHSGVLALPSSILDPAQQTSSPFRFLAAPMVASVAATPLASTPVAAASVDARMTSADAHMAAADAQIASAAVAAPSMTAVPLAAASLVAFHGSCNLSNSNDVTDTLLSVPVMLTM